MRAHLFSPLCQREQKFYLQHVRDNHCRIPVSDNVCKLCLYCISHDLQEYLRTQFLIIGKVYAANYLFLSEHYNLAFQGSHIYYRESRGQRQRIYIQNLNLVYLQL